MTKLEGGVYFRNSRLVQYLKINQFNPPYEPYKEKNMIVSTDSEDSSEKFYMHS